MDVLTDDFEPLVFGHGSPMPLDVRRRDVSSLPREVVDELCAWCGVDRAGSCGACSDLRVVKR
jgi:hypothetical protein